MIIEKAYTNQELADNYRIPYRAWLKWLKKLRKKYPELVQPVGGFWQPLEVQKMVDDLGPFTSEKDEP